MGAPRKTKTQLYYKKWYAKNRAKKLAQCREWGARNKERQKEYRRARYLKNREKIRASTRAYYLADPARARRQRRNYYMRNRERLLELGRRQRADIGPALSAAAVVRVRRRLKSDPYFKFVHTLRTNVRGRIKARGGIKQAKTEALFGCTVPELRAHLARKFKPGMSWENYGFRGWHIDHILPCSSFDLRDPKQQRRCFHFSNLRPLWALENLRKSNIGFRKK